jgi:xanthine dehydrogenase accessory factor
MDGWGFLEQGAELARRGESFALATVVWRQGPSSGKESCRAIITATGELHGWIGGACAEPVVIRQAREVISDGVPRLLLLGTAEQFGGPLPEGMNFVPISCQSEGSLEVYIEPIQPAPHLLVVGHSPMASTLAELSRALGWRTDLIAGQDFTAAAATQRSIVVVATQGHHDEEAVTEAIAARPAYVGLVGSARRGAAVLGYLAERGLPAEELDKVHVPAGLDLGPTTHREIAVAILAELVKLRASGALAAAGAGPAADSGATAPSAAAPLPGGAASSGPAAPSGDEDAVDPVCGMTVTAGPSAYPLAHEGVTYYFCCAGCHGAFGKDPASYLRNETRC